MHWESLHHSARRCKCCYVSFFDLCSLLLIVLVSFREFYTGWLTHWGENIASTGADFTAAALDKILSLNGSAVLYVSSKCYLLMNPVHHLQDNSMI